MTFGTYLKQCRDLAGLKQTQLVEELFLYDSIFSNLESTALGRWERDTVIPSIERKLKIIQYFANRTNSVFPCLNTDNITQFQKTLSQQDVKNFLGESKDHVQKLPIESFQDDEVTVKRVIKDVSTKEKMIAAEFVLRSLTKDIHKLTVDDLVTAANHPSSMFLTAQYQNQSVGMFFSVHVTTEAFEKIIAFELPFREVSISDLIDINEQGCTLLISFFTLNDKIASLLFAEYVVHLLNKQDKILHVGALAIRDSERRMADQMGLSQHKEKILDNIKITSYSASIDDVLMKKEIIQLIFDNP